MSKDAPSNASEPVGERDGEDIVMQPLLGRLEPRLEPVTIPVVPENSIRADSRGEGESEHHPTRCLPSSVCFEHLSPTRSSRGAGLKSRIYSFGISSILL